MRRTIYVLTLSFGGAVAGFAATGCSHSCADIYFCVAETDGGASGSGGQGGGTGGTGGGDACPEDPADGPVSPSCGIWVSALRGDDSNPGTQALPVQTIGKATDLAEIEMGRGGAGRVYACGGDTTGEVYVEAVKLRSGISLFGGFECARGWRHVGEDKPAVIAPMVPGAVALTLSEGASESFITDIRAEAEDALDPGGSSIAVFALDGARATFRRAHFSAGHGADGEDGAPGDHNGAAAKKGLPGNDGANACTMDPGSGGASLTIECEVALETSSGAGGDGGEGVAGNGSDGMKPPAPNPLGYGAGGKAEDPVAGTACTGGIAGAPGLGGANGTAGSGPGRLTEQGFIGAAGGDGGHGIPGQGGGGGGGSIGNAFCGGMPHGGAGGGSGGLGGCGGRGGKGGQAGGSSIGIAVRHATLTFIDTSTATRDGGNGGKGGVYQQGGQGGLPGLGGLGFGGMNGVKGGCGGGVGGQGGNGGNGGGGKGGHSLSIGKVAAAKIIGTLAAYTFGDAGKGGLSENSGEAGTVTDSLFLDP